MKRNIRILGVIFFVFGIIFLLNSNLNFTGAFIGSSNAFSSSFSLILGIIFIIVSFIVFAFTGRLEDNLVETEELEIGQASPVIIDTNFLIEACRNPAEYKTVMRFIKERHDYGKPVIVPKSVFSEFKFISGDEGEKSRIKNLKEALAAYTTTLEDKEGDVLINSDARKKSNHIAEYILRQTPKYLAYKYLSEIDKGEKITVDKFLGKSRGKFSTVLSEDKYEENLHSARREYDKINDRAGIKIKNNLLSSYDVSPADIDVLSSALLLKEIPQLWGNRPLNEIDIITKDSHLIDSSKIFNRTHPGKNKINIREKI